jgi:hypothetical protein
MKRIAIFALALIAIYATKGHACEFCALHNGLGQYNNQGDFISLAYRMTTASTIVTGGTVEPSTGDKLTINTAQFYYQHSVSDELKVMAVLPYIQKTSSTNGETNDASSGIGDPILMARYTFWGDPARQFAAVIVGVKLPTGAKKTDPDGAFSPDLVIGTGSTDPLIGGVYSHNIGNWNYSADALYKFSGKGYDDYQFGNMLNLGLNGFYRFHDNFNVGMGLVGEITDADKNSDGTVADTGGSVFFANPTIQYTVDDFYAELSYQVPAYRNFTGTQLVVDNKVIVSLRYAF